MSQTSRVTRTVRLYVPTTFTALTDAAGLRPRTAHAVTAELVTALPEEDAEGLELVALLAAADECIGLLARDAAAARRRVVAVAEVGAGEVSSVMDVDALPSAVRPPALIAWRDVLSLHVDDSDAQGDVAAAALGDAAALDRAAERDLLWYDVTELDDVRALGVANSD